MRVGEVEAADEGGVLPAGLPLSGGVGDEVVEPVLHPAPTISTPAVTVAVTAALVGRRECLKTSVGTRNPLEFKRTTSIPRLVVVT